MGQLESNTVEAVSESIPDAVYMVSMMNESVTIDREVNHYGCNIDVTNNSIWCSDHEVMLNGE